MKRFFVLLLVCMLAVTAVFANGDDESATGSEPATTRSSEKKKRSAIRKRRRQKIRNWFGNRSRDGTRRAGKVRAGNGTEAPLFWCIRRMKPSAGKMKV